MRAEPAWLFEPRRATAWIRINLGRKQRYFLFRGENPPRGAIINFLLRDIDDAVSLRIEEPSGDRSVELSFEPRPGMNRVTWDLTFPPSKGERVEFMHGLEGAIKELRQRVPQTSQAALDDAMRQLSAVDLVTEDADRQLDSVRRSLVSKYGSYAWGSPLFPTKIGRTTAEAGAYRVVLTVGTRVLEQRLEVREDPLRSKSPG